MTDINDTTEERIITDCLVPDGTMSELLIRDNTLINAIYSGSMLVNRILLQAMYDCQHSKTQFVSYTTKEVASYAGLKESDKIYASLHKAVKQLLEHKIIIINKDLNKRKATTGINVVTFAQYTDGVFSLELNKRLTPYLMDIVPPYTSMPMKELRRLDVAWKKHSFGLRLYEFLSTKLYLLKKKQVDVIEEYVSLSELKIRTGLTKANSDETEEILDKQWNDFSAFTLEMLGDLYPVWKDFRRRILEPAIEEINEKTHLDVSYVPKTAGSGGKVIGLTFYVSLPEAKEEAEILPYAEHEHAEMTEYTEAEMIAAVREIITEDIGDDSIASILSVAGNDIELIRRTYRLAQEQRGSISNLVGWMINAVKGRWADTTAVPVQRKTQKAPSGNRWLKSSHEAKFGFKERDVDFEALERELEAAANLRYQQMCLNDLEEFSEGSDG